MRCDSTNLCGAICHNMLRVFLPRYYEEPTAFRMRSCIQLRSSAIGLGSATALADTRSGLLIHSRVGKENSHPGLTTTFGSSPETNSKATQHTDNSTPLLLKVINLSHSGAGLHAVALHCMCNKGTTSGAWNRSSQSLALPRTVKVTSQWTVHSTER